MTAFLNDDTFSVSDWEDSQTIQRFILFCSRLGLGHVAVFEDALLLVSKAVKSSRISLDVRNRMRALFTRPYAKTNPDNTTRASLRYNANNYVMVSANSSVTLSGRRFAWSYFNGGMLVGLSGSRYGDSFKYLVDEQSKANGNLIHRFSSYMASGGQHLGEPILKRWLYAYKSCNNVDCLKERCYVAFPADCIKHFSSGTLSKDEWLEATKNDKRCARDKTRGAAKFITAIKRDSLAYAYLVSSIIRTAFDNQIYEDNRQDSFSVDVGCVIGAVNGKETTALILYVTNGTVVHIRPYENNADVCAPEIGENLKRYL